MTLGLSNNILWIQIITKIIGIAILIILCRVSIVALCIGITAISCIYFLMQLFYLHKAMKYSGWRLLKSILPSALLSLVMAFSVWLIISVIPGLIWKVLVGIIFGAVVYLALSMIFRNEYFKEVISLVKVYF